MALLTPSALVESSSTCSLYQQDDIVRCLRTSLTAVLTAKLADKEISFDYLKGVFSLARSLAVLCGIPWCDLIASLNDVPELWDLVSTLQDGCSHADCLPHSH